MIIGVDAMGGDFAPAAIVEGVAYAVDDNPKVKLVLVGHKEKISYYLAKNNISNHPNIEIVHAEEVVNMDEKSTVALRKKKNSSITIAAELLRDKKIDAIVSAGHTGAAVAATSVRVRTLPGIERPAISTLMPCVGGHFILADAGANTDCKPENLAQFAILAEAFSKITFGIKEPRIGLLSVGGEEGKGSSLTREAFKILSEMPINFVGNVEGKDIFQKSADVVICDGFVGNVLLKGSEGLAKATMHWLKDAFTQNPLRKAGAMLAKSAFKDLKAIADDEEFGGAPLLGINGICIIGHGSSSPKSIRNAIRVAGEFVEYKINDKIVARLKECNLLEK